MKKDKQLKKVLKELARDPEVKRSIAKAQRKPREKSEIKAESMADAFLLLLAVASRFASKKKARALDELRESLYLLVKVSLSLKENIFDRPEVREFFSQSSRQIYRLAQECVAMVLPKAKGQRAIHGSRSG